MVDYEGVATPKWQQRMGCSSVSPVINYVLQYPHPSRRRWTKWYTAGQDRAAANNLSSQLILLGSHEIWQYDPWCASWGLRHTGSGQGKSGRAIRLKINIWQSWSI